MFHPYVSPVVRTSTRGFLYRGALAAAMLLALTPVIPGAGPLTAMAQSARDAAGVVLYSKAVGVEPKPREFKALGQRVGVNQPVQFVDGTQEVLNMGSVLVLVEYRSTNLPTLQKPADITRARTEYKRLQDTLRVYPALSAYVSKPLAALKADMDRYDTGDRKISGKWLTAAEYEAIVSGGSATSAGAPPSVPTNGGDSAPASSGPADRKLFNFATRDGKKYERIYVSRIDEDSIVVTSEFGASRVRWEMLPDNIDIFPVDVQNRRAAIQKERARKMRDMRARIAEGAERLRTENLTVVGWGTLKSPEELLRVVSAGIGRAHGVAVHQDGTLTTWGNESMATVPQTITDAQEVSVGDMHSIVLRKGGTVYCWGNSGDGRCTPPDNLTNVVAVSAGGRHTLALTAEGKVYAWGADDMGQCTVPNGLEFVVAIAAGGSHSLALTAEGKIVGWGDNSRNQLNVPATARDIIALDCGNNHSVALRSNGVVVAWGDNGAKQCAFPPETKDVRGIAAGGDSSLALMPNRVIGCGDNSQQQLTVTGLSNAKPLLVAVSSNGGLALIPAPPKLLQATAPKPAPPAPKAPAPAPAPAPSPAPAGEEKK
ncbi:hypothetical protein DB346_14510 [Verrucomicrobia bacterium LW23]|nr:hypothetical protein DB346_14510 [Verrucomicrobia bacterium LW23]